MMFTKETRIAFEDILSHATEEEKTRGHVFVLVNAFLIPFCCIQ